MSRSNRNGIEEEADPVAAQFNLKERKKVRHVSNLSEKASNSADFLIANRNIMVSTK